MILTEENFEDLKKRWPEIRKSAAMTLEAKHALARLFDRYYQELEPIPKPTKGGNAEELRKEILE